MNTLCPHIFISKSLLKYLPAHFDIINRTLDIFRNRDFSAVANYHGYTEKGPLKNNLTYINLYIYYIIYMGTRADGVGSFHCAGLGLSPGHHPPVDMFSNEHRPHFWHCSSPRVQKTMLSKFC